MIHDFTVVREFNQDADGFSIQCRSNRTHSSNLSGLSLATFSACGNKYTTCLLGCLLLLDSTIISHAGLTRSTRPVNKPSWGWERKQGLKEAVSCTRCWEAQLSITKLAFSCEHWIENLRIIYQVRFADEWPVKLYRARICWW